MNWVEILGTYGYLAVLVGTFFEGETILIMACFLAHRGYLNLFAVLLTAFVGALCGDQMYFALGRKHAPSFLERRHLKSAAVRVRFWLARRGTVALLGFRFLYGLRTVAPFVIGASGFPPARFLLWNALGAALWCGVIGGAGYLFGQVLESALGDIRMYEHLIVLGLLLVGVVAGGFILWKRRRI